jgi:phospholipid transport system substrate-binding protein
MTQTLKNLSLIVIGLLVPLLAAPGRAAEADPAVQQIETFYAALIDTMKQGKELGLQGRYKQLTAVTQETFDLPGMAQASVGPAWQTISEPDRKAVVDAFERLTISNYAKNFSVFGGEKFTVDPNVKMRNADKIVESKLIGGDGKETPFNYRLRMSDGKWKVIDIYLNGYVSQVALRRADYSTTVASAGAAGLAKKINELADRQMSGG